MDTRQAPRQATARRSKSIDDRTVLSSTSIDESSVVSDNRRFCCHYFAGAPEAKVPGVDMADGRRSPEYRELRDRFHEVFSPDDRRREAPATAAEVKNWLGLRVNDQRGRVVSIAAPGVSRTTFDVFELAIATVADSIDAGDTVAVAKENAKRVVEAYKTHVLALQAAPEPAAPIIVAEPETPADNPASVDEQAWALMRISGLEDQVAYLAEVAVKDAEALLAARREYQKALGQYRS